MSDTIDDFRVLKQFRARLRETFGVPCRACIAATPKAQPTILIPQQECRRHRPHYRDPRPELTQKEIDTL